MWAFLFSHATERIAKERLSIPVAAFQFWEQQDFKALLKEPMDKSAFYKFNPEEQNMQVIAYILIEKFKISSINMLKLHPEIAKEYFN